MSEGPQESWRARANVSEALEVFNSGYLQEVWTKALARREADPEGAVTSARTLLESLCMHILEDAGKRPARPVNLRELSKLTRDVLQIAPSPATDAVFTQLFTGCIDVISAVGSLRNELSDAHGRGRFGTMPTWRHAELAVTLSGAMATYLAALWKGRQPTVKDAIENYIAANSAVGAPQRATLNLVARGSLQDKIASRLQPADIIAHCEERRSKGIAPQTINQDVMFLRLALGDGLAGVFEETGWALRALKLIAKSTKRTRRPTHEEFDAIVAYLRERDKDPRAVLPMADVVEFAVWSGRRIDEICSLRWSDLDTSKHTCKEPGSEKPFPLLEKAWDVVQSRSRKDLNDVEERIFPCNPHSVSAAHTAAKNKLSKTMPAIADLRLNDYRFEAVNRLLEKGHPPHTVARATGMDVSKVVEIHDKVPGGG